LHNNEAILKLNPNLIAHKLLPPSSSITFFSNEHASLQPPSPSSVPIFEVTEDQSKDASRGWAKRFVPETITYESSMEALEDGLRYITHAPLGVHSVTTWTLKDEGEGALVLEETGKVTSNRVLMGFIRGTLQAQHEKLVADFMKVLERHVAGDGEEVEKAS